VRVTVINHAYSIDLRLNQMATLHLSGNKLVVTSWDLGATGTHGGDARYILTSLSEKVDDFIDKYLAVNEKACE